LSTFFCKKMCCVGVVVGVAVGYCVGLWWRGLKAIFYRLMGNMGYLYLLCKKNN
jgi:hypothetical protein